MWRDPSRYRWLSLRRLLAYFTVLLGPDAGICEWPIKLNREAENFLKEKSANGLVTTCHKCASESERGECTTGW
ncbi:hypothetical protein BDZ88DRAFT_410528 [Geranomyces variabilis]|nr:hypothetical protein BDZ88DRAFT_410528 [Geranomyces variabilis]